MNGQPAAPGGQAQDYDPLYTESACKNIKTTTSPLDIVDHKINSKPLLVSELVSNYKGINTSVASDLSNAEPSRDKKAVAERPTEFNKVISDYAD